MRIFSNENENLEWIICVFEENLMTNIFGGYFWPHKFIELSKKKFMFLAPAVDQL